jgi:hypothetical protein
MPLNSTHSSPDHNSHRVTQLPPQSRKRAGTVLYPRTRAPPRPKNPTSVRYRSLEAPAASARTATRRSVSRPTPPPRATLPRRGHAKYHRISPLLPTHAPPLSAPSNAPKSSPCRRWTPNQREPTRAPPPRLLLVFKTTIETSAGRSGRPGFNSTHHHRTPPPAPQTVLLPSSRALSLSVGGAKRGGAHPPSPPQACADAPRHPPPLRARLNCSPSSCSCSCSAAPPAL